VDGIAVGDPHELLRAAKSAPDVTAALFLLRGGFDLHWGIWDRHRKHDRNRRAREVPSPGSDDAICPPAGQARLVVEITWLGHSTVLIELDGVRLLTDPVVRERVGPLLRVAPPVPPGALDAIDAVLLSHMHADHADAASLRRVSSSLVIAPRGAARWLGKNRIAGEVRELVAGEDEVVGSLRVTATPATHDARRWPLGARVEPVGFVVRGKGASAYFAGDTDLYPAMAELAGTIGVGLLPVSGWGPTLGPGHLDPERAAQAAAIIAPRVAVPIHWGTLSPRRPMRRHPDPLRPPTDFARLVAGRAPDVEVRVLAPGDKTMLE
jgi:L-ascorbate metabolism protein UlaG (beta-lactamase superfamily)